MIRVLFIALAVVAVALAIVLDMPLLYVVAGGLSAGAAVMLLLDVKKRERRERPEPVMVAAAPAEDLKAFGILEIRPKSAPRVGSETVRSVAGASPEKLSRTLAGAAEEAVGKDGSVGDGASSPAVHQRAPLSRLDPVRATEAPRPSGAPGQGPLFDSVTGRGLAEGTTGTVRKRARSARIMVEGVADRYPAEVMLSTLRALRAAVDASTVCLLAQEASPLRYRVEAIVSRNAFARHGGTFNASEPLVAGARALVPVIHEIGSGHPFDTQRLGYYHERIAIHQVAFVPLTDGNGETYFLVADTMEHEGLETGTAGVMLTEFGRLIRSMVDAARTNGHSEAIGLRPRRDIIAEEMERARSENRPLALALVHLNGPDPDDSDEDAIRQRAFALRLGSVAEGGRVERFGEMTFGVFRAADADDMADWASDVQIRFAAEGPPLQGGLSVGVAVLGDRHDGPDELRADATHALRESFETGECVILV